MVNDGEFLSVGRVCRSSSPSYFKNTTIFMKVLDVYMFNVVVLEGG